MSKSETFAGLGVAALVWIVGLWPDAAAAESRKTGADRFAEGLVALATQARTHDAVAFARLTGVSLRNPDKWDDQSEEGRWAQWRNPRNRVGVVNVIFHDTLVGDAKWVAFSADLELEGTPCVTVAQIERASQQSASRGGLAFPVVFDAPPPPPYELGQEHAFLHIVGRSGLVTDIVMEATDAGLRGCLKWISLQSTRPVSGAG